MLIGLPGAGKSTVAELAAAHLAAPWCDLDARIAATAGRSIAAIFAAEGEAAFRDLERRAMETALAEPPQFIAAGGGWAAQPGHVAAAQARALVIYLEIPPDVAAARLAGVTDRPLLAGADPGERIDHLYREREAWYRQAPVHVAARRAAADVTVDVIAVARRDAGW